jgi:Transglycosylase SLT domain
MYPHLGVPLISFCHESPVTGSIMFSSAPSQLLTLARKVAASQSLDPALVCAVMEQESGWNPWAMRYDPAFFSKYVTGLYTNNKISASEAYARGFSWGLMQVMGQVARETGFDAPFLSALGDPEQGLASAAKSCAKSSTQWPATPHEASSPGTAAAIPATPPKSSPAAGGNIMSGKMDALRNVLLEAADNAGNLLSTFTATDTLTFTITQP